jgi:hypothetical protein
MEEAPQWLHQTVVTQYFQQLPHRAVVVVVVGNQALRHLWITEELGGVPVHRAVADLIPETG